MEMERVPNESPNFKAELIARLREAAPEAFAEGKFDIEKLKVLLGEAVATGPERYEFNWAGKRDAIAMLQAPTRATLAPDVGGSINFEDAQHVFIEGENLEALKVIYRSYFGWVKLIYIDPPYNTQNDFIYPDNFADPLQQYLRITGQVSGGGDLQSSQTDRSGRYHSSWLSMIFPRLSLARQFLREDGFIVVSIDDAEMQNLRRLMDDVFGEENRIAVLVYDRNRKNDAKMFSVGHEYMIVYARNLSFLKEIDTQLRAPKEGVEEVRAEFERLVKERGENWDLVRDGLLEFYKTFGNDDPRLPLTRYRKVDAEGPFRTDGDISWPGGGGPRYDVPHPVTKRPCKVPKRGWVYATYDRMSEEISKDLVIFGADETTIPSLRRNLFERDDQVMKSVVFSYAQVASQNFDAIFEGKKIFENPKSFTDLERLVAYLSDPGDVVLDFFAGSNTTFHGVVRANRGAAVPRRMISVQMAEKIKPGSEASDNALAMGFETIADIARERARRVLAADEHRNEKIGFRSFKLAPSNMRPWTGVEENTPEAYGKQLAVFADSLVPGWKADGVIWEVALREGYSLTSEIVRLEAPNGGTFWRCIDVDKDQSFTISLDDTLTIEQVRALNLSKADLFICRDTALDDTLAANLSLQCHLKVV